MPDKRRVRPNDAYSAKSLTCVGDQHETEISQTRNLPRPTHGHERSDDDGWPEPYPFLDGSGFLLQGDRVRVGPEANEEALGRCEPRSDAYGYGQYRRANCGEHQESTWCFVGQQYARRLWIPMTA